MLTQPAQTSPRCGRETLIPYPFSLVTAVMLACAGCGTINPVINEANYLTYDHPFTDTAAQAVQQNAEKVCAARKQAAIKTRSVCSLKECATHYQCVDKAAGKN